METTIHPLIRDDEPFLWDALYYAIHTESGEKPSRDILHKRDIARYVADWMQHPDDFGFIAEDDGAPIGAAWLRRWSKGNRGYGFVNESTPELSMSLLPGYRGRGIGTKLLRHLLDAAKEHFDAISLSVSKTNPALHLYEREGFVAVNETEDSSITMVKDL